MLTRLTKWFHILRAGLLVVAALLYCISPIDLVPDMLPIVGWADDLVILATGISSLLAVLRKHDAAPTPPLPPAKQSAPPASSPQSALPARPER